MNTQFKAKLRPVFKLSALFIISTSLLFSLLACDSSGRADSAFKPYFSFLQSMGVNLEGVIRAPAGPYKYKPANKAQRYVAASSKKITVFTSYGEIIATRSRNLAAYGALYLEHSIVSDFLFIFGPNGKEICPIDEGFCQIDSPGISNKNTTDAKYGRNSQGKKVYNEILRVRGGILTKISEDGEGFKDEEVFDGTNMPDATENLVSFDPLSPNTGLGASEDGIVYFINTNTDDAARINDNSVGTDIRDVVCEMLGNGIFACAIQSFIDKKLSLCVGSDESDFECGPAVDVGDGVSIGVAKTSDGNIGVVSTSYADGLIYLTEFTPTFGVKMNLQFDPGEFFALHLETELPVTYIGHAELDAEANALMVTGYNTGDLAFILFDDLETHAKPLGMNNEFRHWFK